jgi:3-oxoacyl-[acyl-carrier protein] reductase
VVDASVMAISGSRTGLGRGLAEHFLSKGWLVAGCSRTPSDLVHSSYRHYVLDVVDEEAVRQMFSSLRREWGRLDVLINNAGFNSASLFVNTREPTLKALLDTNVVGVWNCTREAVRLMQQRHLGLIISISTLAVPNADIGTSAYSASKAAVEQITKVVAKEVQSLGIRVYALRLPFVSGTGMYERAPEAAKSAAVASAPFGRILTIEEVCNAIDVLLDGFPAGGQPAEQIVTIGED